MSSETLTRAQPFTLPARAQPFSLHERAQRERGGIHRIFGRPKGSLNSTWGRESRASCPHQTLGAKTLRNSQRGAASTTTLRPTKPPLNQGQP